MISLKATTKFFDYYNKDENGDIKTQFVPTTTDIKEVILNAIRFKCSDPVIFISENPDKDHEYRMSIKSSELKTKDWPGSEIYFKFSEEDTVLVLCDIDIGNRLIISISTSY